MAILVLGQWRIAMLTFERIATKPVVFQMLTGLALQAFLDLLPAFHRATAHIEYQAEQRRKQPRQRKKGGGCKPLLRWTPIGSFSFCFTLRSTHSRSSKVSSSA